MSRRVVILALLTTVVSTGCAENGELGFKGHPLDCAMGVPHSDCAPATPGAARYAQRGGWTPSNGDALIAAGLGIMGRGLRQPSTAPAYVPYGPSATDVAPLLGGCERGHWISKVDAGGAVVTLEDQTVWLVGQMDRFKTATWLPVSAVAVCGGSLVNTDANEAAQARRVS